MYTVSWLILARKPNHTDTTIIATEIFSFQDYFVNVSNVICFSRVPSVKNYFVKEVKLNLSPPSNESSSIALYLATRSYPPL